MLSIEGFFQSLVFLTQHYLIVLLYTFNFSRTSLSSMAGISAGILGLTGLKGFIFYFVASLFMSVSNESIIFLGSFQSAYDFLLKMLVILPLRQ